MPFALKEFPKDFPITQKRTFLKKSSKKFRRDETRLLVAFTKRMDRQTVQALLHTCGLTLEDAGEREIQEELARVVENCCDELKTTLDPDKRKRFCEELRQTATNRATECQCVAVPDLNRRVAHTAFRFWVRSDQTINQSQVDRLVANPTNKVRWIAPVYQNPSQEGRSGLFSPLPGVLVIEPAKAVDKMALAEKLNGVGLRDVRRRSKLLGGHRYAMLQETVLENGTTVYRLPQQLRKAPQLIRDAWFENVPLLSATSSSPSPQPYNPDDTFFQTRDHWNLSLIDAELGWGFIDWLRKNARQLHPVTICILDSDGVDIQHEEFQGRVVNAYTVPGADTDPDNPLPPGQADQEQPHGTLCAGVATATMDNQKGLAGLAGWAKFFSLMPVRVGESLLGWASGIRYAADAGADVISISMNPALDRATAGNEMDELDAAIAYAVHDKDVVVCVSSGNGNKTDSVQYPATHPDVMACGAINNLNTRCQPGDWPFDGGSSHGTGLSVVAPGVYITTTTPTTKGQNGYSFSFCGTSAATPHVAGLAALLLCVDPDLRPAQVREIIEDSARPLNGYPPDRAGWNKEVGFGLINVSDALHHLP